MQISKTLAVYIFFNAGNACVIDIGKSQDMRANGAVGVNALILGNESHTWQT